MGNSNRKVIPEKQEVLNANAGKSQLDNEFQESEELIKLHHNTITFLSHLPRQIEEVSVDRRGLKLCENCIYNDSIECSCFISHLTKLLHSRTLNLSFNRLIRLPNTIQALTNIQTLNLMGNHIGGKNGIENLEVLANFSSLTSLNLSFNLIQKIAIIEGKPAFPSSLKTLSLRHNPISYLPKLFYFHLINLEELDLSECSLQSLHTKDSAVEVFQLHLHDDKEVIEDDEDCLGSLKNLTSLMVTYNQYLRFIPCSITRLENIRIIKCAHQPIDRLPVEIKSLSTLTSMDLSQCFLSKLPNCFGDLINLEYLNISTNKFKEIPIQLFSLTNLRSLSANAMEIVEIDDQMANLVKLTSLELRFNYLKSLSNSVYKLPHLINLDIGGNSFESIPPGISKLAQLQFLNLSHCSSLIDLPLNEIISIDTLTNISMDYTKVILNITIDQFEELNNRLTGSQALQCYYNLLSSSKIENGIHDGNQDVNIPINEEWIRDRVFGCIFGQAIGDAVGLSTEFQQVYQAALQFGSGKPTLSSEEWGNSFIRDNHRKRWIPYDFTDDTDQLILILKTFLHYFNEEENSGMKVSDVIANIHKEDYKIERIFAKYLKDWAHKGMAELGDMGGLGIGQTVTKVLSHSHFLEDPFRASKEINHLMNGKAAANGAVMRTSVIPLILFPLSLEQIMDFTLNICKVTHDEIRCQSSCVAVSVAIAMIMKGNHNIDSLKNCALDSALKTIIDSKLSSNQVSEYGTELKSFIQSKSFRDLDLCHSTSIGFTYKAMGSAFVALSTYKDFQNAIIDLTMEAGDADTNCAVAGALLGVYLGYSKLPKQWLDKLIHFDWLYQLVEQLISQVILPLWRETL